MSKGLPTTTSHAAGLGAQYAVLTEDWPLVVRHRATGSVRLAEIAHREPLLSFSPPPGLQCLYDSLHTADGRLLVVSDDRQLQLVSELPALEREQALQVGQSITTVILALHDLQIEHGALWPSGVKVRRGTVPHVMVRRPELCTASSSDARSMKKILAKLASGLAPRHTLLDAWGKSTNVREIYTTWLEYMNPSRPPNDTKAVYKPTQTLDDFSALQVETSTDKVPIFARRDDLIRLETKLLSGAKFIAINGPRGAGISTLLEQLARHRDWLLVRPDSSDIKVWRNQLDALVVDLDRLDRSSAERFVAKMRARYPQAQLIVGHHEALALPGAQSFLVTPLSPSQARRLFFGIAVSVSPEVDLIRDEAAVDRICQLVGWWPGPVRKLAYRTRERSCSELVHMVRLHQLETDAAATTNIETAEAETADAAGPGQAALDDLSATLRSACVQVLDADRPLDLDEIKTYLRDGVTMFEVLDVLLGRGLADLDPVTGQLIRILPTQL
jgi:hypothetical protein